MSQYMNAAHIFGCVSENGFKNYKSVQIKMQSSNLAGHCILEPTDSNIECIDLAIHYNLQSYFNSYSPDSTNSSSADRLPVEGLIMYGPPLSAALWTSSS